MCTYPAVLGNQLLSPVQWIRSWADYHWRRQTVSSFQLNTVHGICNFQVYKCMCMYVCMLCVAYTCKCVCVAVMPFNALPHYKIPNCLFFHQNWVLILANDQRYFIPFSHIHSHPHLPTTSAHTSTHPIHSHPPHPLPLIPTHPPHPLPLTPTHLLKPPHSHPQPPPPHSQTDNKNTIPSDFRSRIGFLILSIVNQIINFKLWLPSPRDVHKGRTLVIALPPKSGTLNAEY